MIDQKERKSQQMKKNPEYANVPSKLYTSTVAHDLKVLNNKMGGKPPMISGKAREIVMKTESAIQQ